MDEFLPSFLALDWTGWTSWTSWRVCCLQSYARCCQRLRSDSKRAVSNLKNGKGWVKGGVMLRGWEGKTNMEEERELRGKY